MSTDGVGGGGAPAGGTPPAPAVSPEELADLRAAKTERDQYEATFRSLEPYAEDIKRIRDDEDYRNASREYQKVYDDLKQRRPAGHELSPEMQRLRDDLVGEFKPLKDAFESRQQQEHAAARDRESRVFQEGAPIIKAFRERHPDLVDNPVWMNAITACQRDAVNRNVTFKEVWDNFTSGFETSRPAAPPRQLRANAGEQGIPAAQDRTRPPANGEKKSVVQAFLETHRRVNGKAS